MKEYILRQKCNDGKQVEAVLLSDVLNPMSSLYSNLSLLSSEVCELSAFIVRYFHHHDIYGKQHGGCVLNGSVSEPKPSKPEPSEPE